MIFLTVGTQFPFDRLVRAVDEAVGAGVLAGPVVAQIARGRYEPRHLQSSAMLSRDGFHRQVRQAEAIVGHAGIGTILAALEADKPLLVMPRLRRFGEHVNDHQVDTARTFEAVGHVLAAYAASQVAERLADLRTFRPKPRRPRSEPVVRRLADFLARQAHAVWNG